MSEIAIGNTHPPRGPDFMIIGAPRSGTSWLFVALREVPTLWLAPVKELHYFDKPHRTRTWFDPYEWRRVRPIRFTPWYWKYLFGKRNDAWYASLFQRAQQNGFISGEATPDYGVLRPPVLCHIRQMNPDIKLIFVMRDPVDRSWSELNNAMRKGRIEPPLTLKKTLDWVQLKGRLNRSLYVRTITRIEDVFPRSQLHYCFFDDLARQPERFIRSVLSFLGVSDLELPVLPAKRVNAVVEGASVPTEIARELARIFLPSVDALCERFNGPPQAWRERYRHLLDGAGARSGALGQKEDLSQSGAS